MMPVMDWVQRGRPGLVVSVSVPHTPSEWMRRKVKLRAAFSPAVVGVAATWRLNDDRITMPRLFVGSGPVLLQRLQDAERLIHGRVPEDIDGEAFEAAILTGIDARDDAWRSADYRRRTAWRAFADAFGLLSPRKSPARQKVKAGDAYAGQVVSNGDTARWHTRPDMAAKVDGQFRYMTDKADAPVGALVGRILRAGIPHARIVSIDVSKAEAMPGVTVVTARDIEGENGFGIVTPNQPAFAFDRVRYAGEAVAAVAAPNERMAAKALAAIEIIFDPLPVVSDMETAEGDEPLWEVGNVAVRFSHGRGDPAAAFAAAVHIVETTTTTPRQMHAFMETEGGWANITQAGGLEIHVGGQHGARDRLQLARITGLPEAHIQVVTSPTGGAFGGKDELTVQPALALLAMKSGRPVRLRLDRLNLLFAVSNATPCAFGCEPHPTPTGASWPRRWMC